MTERRRVLDGVVGALILVLVQLLLFVAAFFWLSRPAGESDTAIGGTPTTSDPATTPPANLPAGATWVAEAHLTSSALQRGGTPLRNVDFTVQNLVSSGGALTVGSLQGSATAPFEAIATQVGGDAKVSYVDAEHLKIERSVTAFGRTLQATAIATVIPDGSNLTVQPTSLSIDGSPAGEAVANATRPFLTVSKPVPGLPADATVDKASITPDGLQLTVSGTDLAW